MSEPTSQPESTPEDPKSLDQLLAEAQVKIEEQRNAWLRALADADNARKRAQADIVQARRFAVERMVEDLLPAMDSLEATLAAQAAGDDPLRSGVDLTLKLLRAALERAGVTEIAPLAGERFDPHRHQAMAAVESDAEPNTVVSVMQKGYLLHDRVVRAALVTVAKARPANDPAQA
ncbi:MAG: nucleotide exchange factor GrpE [Burkholderiales bacterium]